MTETTALILAGGRSSRLFPFNKVLSDLTGSGRTLLQQARDRLRIFSKEAVYVLTTQDMAASIRKQLRLSSSHIFVDPVRRGTWPAILWAMAHLRQKHPDAVMAVVTGDHVIQNENAFQSALRQALRLAKEKPAIVMLGISPRQDPQEWSGFGCFRTDASGHVVQFQEKPASEEAQHMIDQGGWSWNSGMFFFRLSTAEKALRVLQPEMARVYEAMATALAKGKKTDAAFIFEDFPEKIPHPFDPAHYVDNSIDYAIMTSLVQRATSGLEARAVRQVRFQWSDLGQWDALRTVLKSDRHGNIRVGKGVLKGNVRNSLFVAEKGYTIDASNVQDLIAVVAGQMALVLTPTHLAHVKKIGQETLAHPDRVVVEHDVTNCDIHASAGRIAAIGLSGLRVQLIGRRLVVSTKDGFIR